MRRRWWLLFRGLAVPTILFLAPALAVQKLVPLSYYLSMSGAVAEVALEVFALLAAEAVCTALLTLALSTGRALGLCADRAEENCAGLLCLMAIALCALTVVYPLDMIIGPVPGVGLEAALLCASVTLLTFYGWQRFFAALNRLNRSAQAVLAVCPLLLIVVLAGGFGWRGFGAMPAARRSGPAVEAKANVVLISFDAMAAQDMSLYGYRLRTTPRFERLARRSYNFTDFVSTSDFTTPAVASLLTGQYPLTNRVFQLYGHIPHRLRRDNLAWILRRDGYTTAAIVTNPAAHPLALRIAESFSVLPRPPVSSWIFPGTFLMQVRHGLLFDAVNGVAANAVLRLTCLFAPLDRTTWIRPRAVFGSAEEFIRGARAPYFLWVHLYPPHAPYLTSASFRGRFLPGSDFTTQAQYFWETPGAYYQPPSQHQVDLLRLRYDESIGECDSALGEFLDWMAASGNGADTILIVTADHGENFADGWWSHESRDLHYPEIHIPLLISLPGQDRGVTRTEDGDLTDIAPTILSLLGIATPRWMDGRALIGAATKSGPSFSMYLAESRAHDCPTRGAIAANAGHNHLVWYFPSMGAQLFDIARDPEQRHVMAPLHPPYPPGIPATLVGEIQRKFADALGCRSHIEGR